MSTDFEDASTPRRLRARDVAALLREIQRYLVYVEAVRRDGRRQKPAEREGGKDR